MSISGSSCPTSLLGLVKYYFFFILLFFCTGNFFVLRTLHLLGKCYAAKIYPQQNLVQFSSSNKSQSRLYLLELCQAMILDTPKVTVNTHTTLNPVDIHTWNTWFPRPMQVGRTPQWPATPRPWGVVHWCKQFCPRRTSKNRLYTIGLQHATKAKPLLPGTST